MALPAAAVILLALMAFLETRQPFACYRLATFGLAFLALVFIAILLRGAWRDGLLVAASLAFGLFAIEAAAILMETRALAVLSAGFAYPQPVIGVGPQRAGSFHAEKTDPKTGHPIYSVDYTINSNLLRETQSGEGGPTIVFFGDSFTFGEGLSDADTLPQQFADALGRKQRVLNLAYPGYGPQHFLAEMQTGRFDSVIGFEPRLFIFQTGAGLHTERTVCKPFWSRRWPRYAIENDQFVFKGACSEGFRRKAWEWFEDMASYRVFIEPYLLKRSRQDVEFYVRILLASVKTAKEKYGVPVLIPYVKTPRYLEGTGFSDDGIIQRLQDGGALVVDVSLTPEAESGAMLQIKGDGHPTALANRLKASIIKDYIERHAPESLIAGLQ